MHTSHTLAHGFAATLLALSLAAPATAAVTAAELKAAAATHRADVAACNNGSSKQTRSACLDEAHSAYNEARRGVLGDAMPEDHSNATKRCAMMSGADQDACMARMQGMGRKSGSAAAGGIYRELSTTMPVKPAASAPR